MKSPNIPSYSKRKVLRKVQKFVPFTNRVQGLDCKLRTEVFPAVRNARAINQREKTSTYSTDQRNEVSKILTISLRLIGRAGNETR